MSRTPVGEALLRMRHYLHLSQERFAEKVGMSEASIARFETLADPGPKALVRFADLARSLKLTDVARVLDDAIARKYGAVAPGRVAELMATQAARTSNIQSQL